MEKCLRNGRHFSGLKQLNTNKVDQRVWLEHAMFINKILPIRRDFPELPVRIRFRRLNGCGQGFGFTDRVVFNWSAGFFTAEAGRRRDTRGYFFHSTVKKILKGAASKMQVTKNHKEDTEVHRERQIFSVELCDLNFTGSLGNALRFSPPSRLRG